MQRPPPWPYGGAAGPSSSSFYPPIYFLTNNNAQFPGNLQYVQPPPSNPQPVFQNPRAVLPQKPYRRNPGPKPSQFPEVTLAGVESAAAKSNRDILTAGENVTAWKVSQSALVVLKVDSWSSLGFQLQDVPTLKRLLLLEGKVNAFIHCFVCARKITSIYELEVYLCKNEGVMQFEELGLGPFLQHPLVKHYFSVTSDSTEVFKITSEEIIRSLQTFMSKFKKKVSAEEFLSFLAQQKSIPVKENLGIRIQDIGSLVYHMRKASKAENTILREKLNGSDVGSGNVVVFEKVCESQPPSIALEKQVLDKRFDYISSCVKSFSSKWIDFGGKHVYFNSSSEGDDTLDVDGYSDDEDDGEDNTRIGQKQSFSHGKGLGQYVSSCPYPSKAEEMIRLGLKPVDADKTSHASGHIAAKGKRKFHASGHIAAKGKRKFCRSKRKIEENNKSASSSCKFLKRIEAVDLEGELQLPDLTLSNADIEKFATTWKEACRGHSVVEVFDIMLSFYVEAAKQRRKIRKLVSSYPVIGLLNIAIMSIKRGMLESLYDTFQALNEKEFFGMDSCFAEIIDVRPMVEDSLPIKTMDSGFAVTTDGIFKKITNYFENYLTRPKERGLSLEKQLASLKNLHDCEMWLIAQFNVQDFSSLGHGNFYDFLEKHISLLPHEVHAVLYKEQFQATSMDVCLVEQQLGIMLSQAEGNLITEVDRSGFDIVSLLRRQFPAASFCMVGLNPEKHFEDLVSRHKDSGNSSCVLFSMCLLGGKGKNFLVNKENSSMVIGGMETEIAQQYHYRRTSKDAIECLLKAPMLSDLLQWSHWDLLYAPSLGPLAEWLLNKVNNKQLLCIATTNGKFIRVDHSSTIDEFLETLVQCSSFNAALKFLSLLCHYRGTRNAPLALLKCCAQKAVNVVIGNFTDSVEINGDVKSFTQGKIGLGSTSSFGIVSNNSVEQYNQNSVGSTLCTSVCRVNRAIAAVSRTLLGCLQYLPSEFRSFAADILLSGFRSIVKHAPIAVLNECTQPDERIMLHDIGLLLGVTEWVVDHQQFSSSTGLDLSLTSTVEGSTQSFYLESVFDHRNSVQVFRGSTSGNHRISLGTTEDAFVIDGKSQLSCGVDSSASACRVLKNFGDSDESQVLCEPMALSIDISEEEALLDATAIVESIRREEFGLNSDSNQIEDHLLKKQHARLGRALHCLSQELYSQDSHFILELVQNADDNIYSDNLEPELVFILEEAGIVVLNNEIGFSAANIRALCDIGNSTKKGSSGGYIGKKGIGFKSVFRVTDAPEIHSNGFHVKFDITEGQIGFVLPTIISPCNVNTFKQYLCDKDNQGNNTAWNTCILLPFRSQSKGAAGVNSIISMFSDLHPSLLLFLHRLRCIKFKNLLRDEFVVMRKETLHNGIIKISHGREVMSWLVISKKLRSSVLRTDIEATEISMAFTLQELDDGEYKPCLSYQPVFSFLPLRNYGLRFILQGDFVLPSSREEVDGDSAWNQWLLSEFPSLFVNAKQSFCALPCFLKSPGKALTIYMSFVPLVGEVHGFFSQLPHMLISLLRISKCLLQDSPNLTWVLPCRVLRGWNEQAHLLLSDPLLQRHLGLVYMHKDVILSDTLARALGIRDYGPKVLVEVIASLCHSSEDLKSLGLDWLSAWLAAVHSTLSMHFSGHSSTAELENDVINDLRYIPFIPLSDGSYGCLAHGPIWLPCDVVNIGSTGEYHPEDFPCLYTKLRIVTPHLFMSATKTAYNIEGIKADVIMQMLLKIGVQQLSAHEVIRNHILDALSEKRADDRDLMIEYLSFIMLHFQFDCGSCHSEKADIILELRKLPVVLTNHGFKYPFSEPIHFGSEYGNPIDIVKLLDAVDIKWVEVDPSYLNHPSIKPLSSVLTKWRSFFIDLGVTDFVQVTCTDKNARDFLSENKMNNNEFVAATSYVKDWESPELVNLLSAFSSKEFRGKCIYLLEVLDKMWDDCYSDQARSFIIFEPDSVKKPIVSSFMKNIHEFAWIASTIDMDLHQPKSLFYDCEQVRSVLGTMAAYAYPQVSSKLLVEEIGFKMEVSIDDALEIFWFWRMSGSPFVASIAQMVKFYTFISNGISTSSSKIIKELILSRFIFIPFINSCQSNAPASGLFGSPMEVHWQDPTGCVDRMKELMPLCTSTNKNNHILCLTLATVYPSLHDFFVNACGVPDTPPFGGYFQILQQLSGIALPSQAAHNVFLVMVRWANDLKSGLVSLDQISELKESFLKLENTVLPTELDRWVSLHPSFGLICWSDDDELKKQFKHSDGVDFMQFGDLSMEESVLLSGAVSTLLHIIGVPALSEIVSREAIFYGTEDNKEKVALVNWVLPYAQRYIYKLHMDAYLKLKQLGFEKINQLKVVVVSKLFYKYILRGRDCDSKGRFECNCLLQGSTLYIYKATDSHSIFSELSRFFFNGSAELHFANFLHMVTTMAETGSTYEQIDFFIVNTQKLSKLPDEEPLWSLPLMCDVDEHTISPLVPVPSMELENSISKSSTRRPGIGTNWPPTDWKNAPDFSSSITRNLRTRPWIPPSAQDGLCEAAEDVAHKQDPVSVDITGNWTIEEGSMPESSSMLQDSQLDSVGMHENSVSESIDHLEGPNDVSGKKSRSINPFKLLNRDRISWKIANEQMRRTGRLGEMIAYQYFTEKLSLSDVKWVNQETETGLPYDLVVGVEESRQYIEVKATSSVTKDWFDITTREWLFAAEKGDSYSIAHVAIFGPNKATVTVLKNPFKLCQQNLLSLAILMSRRVQD